MAVNSLFSLAWSVAFLIIACFYVYRFASVAPWLEQLDAENEVGHGVMAVGMALMLAPFDVLTDDLLRWNSILFALASLWFILRLLTHRPLLALLLDKNRGRSTVQSDAIHALMHAGMSFMFLLMSSMTFSMTRPATYLICLFLVAFAFLTVFYSQEVFKGFQATQKDWLKPGANLAHLLMSGVMAWMFLEMLTMTMSMVRP